MFRHSRKSGNKAKAFAEHVKRAAVRYACSFPEASDDGPDIDGCWRIGRYLRASPHFD